MIYFNVVTTKFPQLSWCVGMAIPSVSAYATDAGKDNTLEVVGAIAVIGEDAGVYVHQ